MNTLELMKNHSKSDENRNFVAIRNSMRGAYNYKKNPNSIAGRTYAKTGETYAQSLKKRIPVAIAVNAEIY